MLTIHALYHYVPVAERLKVLHEAKKPFEIIESQPYLPGKRCYWQVTCLIDGKKFIGSAEVHLNAKPGSADATDPFAVAETSAVGRALGFAGWGSIESICSADELLRTQPGTQITIVESAKPALPPADEETRARLNTLFQIGKGQGLFAHKRGMATYASQILDRTVTAEELTALSHEELDSLLDALNGVGLEAAS